MGVFRLYLVFSLIRMDITEPKKSAEAIVVRSLNFIHALQSDV